MCSVQIEIVISFWKAAYSKAEEHPNYLLRVVRGRARFHRFVRRHPEAGGHREHRRFLHQRIDFGIVMTGPRESDALWKSRFRSARDCVSRSRSDRAFFAWTEHVWDMILIRGLNYGHGLATKLTVRNYTLNATYNSTGNQCSTFTKQQIISHFRQATSRKLSNI